MFRKAIYIFLLFLLVVSCGGTFDSVKRGLTGAKANTADEFLVKKKDPLILPPDFENLPIPDEEATDIAENTIEKLSAIKCEKCNKDLTIKWPTSNGPEYRAPSDYQQ